MHRDAIPSENISTFCPSQDRFQLFLFVKTSVRHNIGCLSDLTRLALVYNSTINQEFSADFQ
jgi:hypothetical protein